MHWLSSPFFIQLRRFLIVGSMALVLDLGSYYFLSSITMPLVAKIISFIIATQFVFVCNKYWTFAETKTTHNRWQFFQFNTLYLVTLGANGAVYTALLYFTSVEPLPALLLASASSTIINFVVQRHWIFHTRH